MGTNFIGHIRILSTEEDVGVVGVTENKKSLNLEKMVNIGKIGDTQSVARDMEGVLWCWIQQPAKNVLPAPTIINTVIGYIKIRTTNYIFGVAHYTTNKKSLRLFCSTDGTTTKSPPQDIHKYAPNFPNISNESLPFIVYQM